MVTQFEQMVNYSRLMLLYEMDERQLMLDLVKSFDVNFTYAEKVVEEAKSISGEE